MSGATPQRTSVWEPTTSWEGPEVDSVRTVEAVGAVGMAGTDAPVAGGAAATTTPMVAAIEMTTATAATFVRRYRGPPRSIPVVSIVPDPPSTYLPRVVPTAHRRRTMKAAVYYETGGPEVFRYEDVPDPTCGPGEVLVRVQAISIEGGDTLNRLGGDLGSVPHIVGYQCAGEVLEVGDGVDDLSPGDRVVTVGLDGSHAELRVAGRSFCWSVPDGVSDRGGGVRTRALRHRRRLPLRVRSARRRARPC